MSPAARRATTRSWPRIAARLGYPVLVKAVAGGGGKGMRLVASAAELGRALELARTEARQSFGDPALYLERALPRARHVEIQVLGDGRGKVVHLLERECSIQRRHQKLIEETPSPAVDEELRRAMGEAAVRACAALGYRGAGTVEFLLEPDGRFWFLEMNTRLQVEHPITEARTGIDLVAWQLRLAAGEPLALEQERIGGRGHAIECRICAEDPAREFLPSAGRLLAWLPPAGPGLRLDSGVRAGDEVTLHYDPLLAKLIAWDESRDRARQRLLAALDRFVVLGLQTNLPLLRAVLAHPAFTAGETHTRFLEEEFGGWQPAAAELADEAVLAAAVLDHLQAARPSSDAGGLRHGTAAAGEPYSPWRGPHRRSAVIGAGLEQGTAGGGAR
ncbi:MAG: hypothetical protein KatS3mg102_1038 [Planctomycetota bacterium]|nr:MAG: hypothetical protein KatS3mg102_1038 [Planctomycetota bacterium]